MEPAGEQARRHAVRVVNAHTGNRERAPGDEHQRYIAAAAGERAAGKEQRAFAAESDGGMSHTRLGAQRITVEIQDNALIRVQQHGKALGKRDIAQQRHGVPFSARQAQRLHQTFSAGNVAQFAGIGGGRERQRAAVHIGEQHLRAVADFAQLHGGKAVCEAQQHSFAAGGCNIAMALEGKRARFKAVGTVAFIVRRVGNGNAFQAAEGDASLCPGAFEAQNALRRGHYIAGRREQRAGEQVGSGGDGDVSRRAFDGHGLARRFAAVFLQLQP